MESKEFRINFKKYREHCKTNSIQIPRWMNHIIFNEVVRLMENNQKLLACKFLCDKSTEKGTRNIDAGQPVEFGLKWAKNNVADVIESFRVIHEYEAPAPIKPYVSIDRIKDTIAPFAEIGQRYFKVRELVPNEVQVVLKTKDLRKIFELYATLQQYGEL